MRQFELFGVFAPCVLGPWVVGANMQCELSVALQLNVPQHLIERIASGHARKVEDPRAFGATPTPKMLLFNPCQLPIHAAPGRAPHRSLAACPVLVSGLRLQAVQEADEVYTC